MQAFKESRLCGIVPPLVTPLLSRDRLDVEGLGRLVDRVLGGGVHGVFVLGTSGEGPGLSYELRREVIDRVVPQVAGRVPVLVGVTETSTAEMLALARHAADAGADAVVVAPPYYFPLSQGEFLAWFTGIASSLPLPVWLYNMPGCVKMHLEIDTVRRVMDLPGVRGFKDSSGDMTYYHRARSVVTRPDQSLLIGPEELLGESVLFGGDGGVSGGANLFPRLYVDLYDAALREDLPEVLRLQARVLRISKGIYGVGSGGTRVIQGLKSALSILGVCSEVMAEPFRAHSAEKRGRIQQFLESFGEASARRRPAASANGRV